MMYFTGCVPTDPRIPWYVPVGRMWPGVAWRHDVLHAQRERHPSESGHEHTYTDHTCEYDT